MFTNRTGSTSIARWMLAVGLIAAGAATGDPAIAYRGDRVVVFGTSLSDPGNAFVFTGGTNGPPGYSVNALLIPDRPYSTGGHHFSNGATWIEQFGASRGLGPSVQAAFIGDGNASNYAVGAARAREDGVNFNLPAQVSAFLEQFDGVAPADALYVIEMGSNDVRDAATVAAGGGNPVPVLQAALASIATHIASLHSSGARRFLVWSVPNISLTPAVAMIDAQLPGAKAGIDQLTLAFNAGLNLTLGSLSALPGIQVRTFDTYQLVTDMVGNPAAFGLTNVEAPCIMPNVAPFKCDDPDEFLFWDGIHPTRAVHSIVAHQAGLVLAQ